MGAEAGDQAGWRCLAVRPRDPGTAPAALARQARLLGVACVESIDRARLLFVRGDLDDDARDRLTRAVLTDPLVETATWERTAPPGTIVVETVLHPGVTDPVASAAHRGAALAGIGGVEAIATGWRFEIRGAVGPDGVDRLVERLLANPVIETATVGHAPPPGDHDATPQAVADIAVRDLDDAALLALASERGLALDLAEMHAVRDWFREQGREPTDVELEAIAQTWSEHCAHKTFRAAVTWDDGEPVEPLLRQLRQATEAIAAPWVRSAFVDNAGIVAFDDDVELSIKAETHNHPSAIEPFGGSNTGVGGVIRDVLGVSARPIAVTDVLCFGLPDADPSSLPAGVLHPRRIRNGVVAGVADYGNKLGVPTVAGAIVHDPGYTANPLVFCGCVGVAPIGAHRTEPQVGDRVVVIGGRTGRDGIRGATFSSLAMDATTGEVAGASVQIGDPVVEKGVLDVLLAARDAGLYHAVTDCGAGGLSSAVGEMAAGLGADVELDQVPRKYPGLAPWEVWLSEAQERMVLAVGPDDVDALRELCHRFEVELTDLGSFTGDKRLVVRSAGRPVLDLDVTFLHEGRPTRSLLAARARQPAVGEASGSAAPAGGSEIDDPLGALLGLLAHPSLRSQLDVVRGYDHEVLGRTAVKPYGGRADDGPSDAAVIVPAGSTSGAAAVLGIGVNARFGGRDAHAMAWAVVDESIRNVVATGADPDRIALLDNFSWGDPRRPATMGLLVEAVRGCCEAAVAHQAPFVSGKDSLNNEYATADGTRLAIPPTLVIHALGRAADLDHVVTTDLKAPGDAVYLVGRTRSELGGSHLEVVVDGFVGATVPQPDREAPARYRRLHRAIAAGLVRACHDVAEGGVAVAAAEMAIAGRHGIDLELAPTAAGPGGGGDGGDRGAAGGDGGGDGQAGVGMTALLFAESNGRLLVEVSAGDAAAFEAVLGAQAVRIGAVTAGERVVLRQGGEPLIDADLTTLLAAWSGHHPEPPPTPSPATARATAAETAAGWVPGPGPGFGGRAVPALVLAAPGTNRDGDVAEALRLAGAAPEVVPLAALRDNLSLLAQARMVVVAGGFSFADSLGSGKLFSLELADILGDGLANLVAAGRPVLGICNGFQVLVRLGLLPGAGRPGALAPNVEGRFECRWVTLAPGGRSVWTAGLDEPITCPVAHGEGRFVTDAATLGDLERDGQIVLRYATPAAATPAGAPARATSPAGGYPANPNGSLANIAGLTDATGLVLGMMPHPENHVHHWQHPRWRRGERWGSGLALFANGVRQASA